MCLRSFLLCGTCAAAVLSGCAVDQKKEVETYRKIIDEGNPPTTLAAGEPLSLEKAMLLANQTNERLGLQGERYLQAIIARQRAAAAFLPTISLAPTLNWSEHTASGNNFIIDNPGAGGGGGTTGGSGSTVSSSRKNWSYSVPVRATGNLFNGFRDVNAYRAAEGDIQQQRALLLDAQAVLLLDVATTYYRILGAERSIEVLKNSLNLQEERLREIRARQRAGMAIPLDQAQTEAQTSATRVSLLNAQTDAINGRNALEALIGQNVQSNPLEDRGEAPPTIESLDDLLQQAFERRQDLVGAREASRARRYDVEGAVGQYYPSLSANFSYILFREPRSAIDWTSVFTANVPIFSAGLIEADVRNAWSLYRQAKLNEAATEKQVRQDVEIGYQNAISSQKRIDELEVQVRAAEQALTLAERSYRNGLVTNLDRLAAQDALLSAQLQLAQERYNNRLFYLTLARATGGLTTRLPGELPPATRPAVELQSNPTTLPTTGAAGVNGARPTTRPAP